MVTVTARKKTGRDGKPPDGSFWRDLDGCVEDCIKNDPDVKYVFESLLRQFGVEGAYWSRFVTLPRHEDDPGLVVTAASITT